MPKSFAQKNTYVLKGLIKDPATDEKLPYVTVRFINSNVGTKSDLDGNYIIEQNTIWPSDSIEISYIGYQSQRIGIDKNIKTLVINIELNRSTAALKEIIIKYDPNPSLSLMKKVIKNKPYNDFNKANNYKYEVYNKLELDISRIPKLAFTEKGPLKDFRFIKNYIDTASEEKPFLPLFLTESISDYYYQDKPKKSKEVIKGTRISGYKNESVSQFLGSMYQNINVYNNMIPVFEIDFVSPISNSGPAYYKYEISDTIKINYQNYFKVLFEPKRKGDHCFTGDIWIHDKDYAVYKVSMSLDPEQQINWVDKVNLVQEFQLFQDTIWFLVKDKFFVDFIASKNDKSAGFIGRKTTTYKNIVLNDSSVIQFLYDKKNRDDIIVVDKANDRDENYWNTVRHDSLSQNEKAIYKMIDTIQSLPIYNKYYNWLYFLSTGIKEIGPLEIGPLYNAYSFNPIEGNRIRLSAGTTPKLFKDIYINGYTAYGTTDKKFKYYINALFLLDRKPRRYINLTYKYDLDNQLNYYDYNTAGLDNFFSTLGRKKNIPWKLVFVDQKRVEFFNETKYGFKQLLSLENKITTPYLPLPAINILQDKNGQASNFVNQTELGLELRFDYHEKFVEGNYWRTSLGTDFPSSSLYLAKGIKNIFNSSYDYYKIRFRISDYQNMGHAGKLYYNVFAGKIIGTLPYLLLEIHPGNEYYYYNAKTFNMMNRFEYLSDTYAGIIMEHSLGSFFFKYIPYLRDTKIRTFWNAKSVYGKLSDANTALNFNKGFDFQSLSTSPYLEMGTGVENIFRVLRLDLVWRILPVTRSNDSAARRFGIFGSVKFEF